MRSPPREEMPSMLARSGLVAGAGSMMRARWSRTREHAWKGRKRSRRTQRKRGTRRCRRPQQPRPKRRRRPPCKHRSRLWAASSLRNQRRGASCPQKSGAGSSAHRIPSSRWPKSVLWRMGCAPRRPVQDGAVAEASVRRRCWKTRMPLLPPATLRRTSCASPMATANAQRPSPNERRPRRRLGGRAPQPSSRRTLRSSVRQLPSSAMKHATALGFGLTAA
mmetsp:Transcript_78074/g.167523  ORF Transcript_78074/g.167523 Transcript_78074/m.167523 type:complete len:221 (+) Transcript_78074:652-1314(+)